MGFVKHAARAITKPVEHAVKSVVHNPVKALPAVVGMATGNPWAVAGAGAVSGASSGGGLKGAALGAAGAGFGSVLGDSIGGAVGDKLGSVTGNTVTAFKNPALGTFMIDGKPLIQSGISSGLGSAIKSGVRGAVSSVASDVAKKNPTILPGLAVAATGNPLVAAGTSTAEKLMVAAGTGAVSGAAVGGVKGAVRGAVGAGLGAAAGGTLGSALGSSSTIGSFLGSSVAPTALAAAGATYGANTALKKFIQQPALAEAYAPPTPLPDPVPTFKLQKQNAIAQTEKAFQENGINNILNGFLRNSRLRDNSKEITIYNRNKFYNPSLKEYMKMVKKKLGIKTSVVYAKDRDRVHLD